MRVLYRHPDVEKFYAGTCQCCGSVMEGNRREVSEWDHCMVCSSKADINFYLEGTEAHDKILKYIEEQE